MGILRTVVTRSLSHTVLTGPRKRFVFLYHDISEPDAPQYSPHYSTRIRNFKLQIELIARHFELVSLDEIVAKGDDYNRRLASLTFDDGFLSVKDQALPYLTARGIPFSVFVNSMAIKDNRLFNQPKGSNCPGYDQKVFLDERDIKELAALGITIGSHCATHQVLVECDEPTLRAEVLTNKIYIESLTRTDVRHLAIPFGKREHYNEEVLNFCFSVGHDYAYTTNPSYFDLMDKTRNRRLIPRVGLLDESPEELYFLINRPLLKKINI